MSDYPEHNEDDPLGNNGSADGLPDDGIQDDGTEAAHYAALERDSAPLLVDASPLHALVDQLSAALHAYVDTAVGVRSEFDAETADDDPRVEVAEQLVEQFNTAFDTAFEDSLGMVCGHTGLSWDEEDGDDEDDLDELTDPNLWQFELNADATRSASPDVSVQDALSALKEQFESFLRGLEPLGYETTDWYCAADLIDDDSDDDDSDNANGEGQP